MKKFLHDVAERIKSMREGRASTEYRISWDEKTVRVEWLTLENDTGSLSFSWDSVLAVDTFKRDFLTADCICLAFETNDGWIEVNEDMKGWSNFIPALESCLPGFPPQKIWLHDVALPAFATKHARLWTKSQMGTKSR
jgi:hypothetical protein